MKTLLFVLTTLSLIGSASPISPLVCDDTTLQGNCVLYARSQVPSLPTGLTTFQGNLNIINHRFPRQGSVAVMPAPGSLAAYGHVSVVRQVAVRSDGGLKLTVDESNYGDCAITRRTITPEQRNIQGYFDPAYPSGQSSPKLDSVTPSNGPVGKQFIITANGSGFDSGNVQAIILGGWCDAFNKCAVPTAAITNRSSNSIQIPVTLNSPGTYRLYVFNSGAGKTSNGKPVTVN